MEPLTTERASELVRAMSGRRVVVFGDVMLDEFVWGDVTRISPEAPVPVVDIRRESVHLGGAANVLANLRALGLGACVVGVVGGDAAGELSGGTARGGRARPQLSLYGPSSPHRPDAHHRHNQLSCARPERRTPVDASVEAHIVAALRKMLDGADAFIVSDYDKGAVTPRVLAEILPLAFEAGVPVLIDPKIRNFDAYRPATLVTPNHHEALRLTNSEDDSDEGVARAARAIREKLGCRSVLITRGERGMMLLEEGGGEPVYVPTAAREVYDVTGAGDTVIATLASALAAGATLVEAAMLANHAAGIVVAKVGTAIAAAEELVASFAAAEHKL